MTGHKIYTRIVIDMTQDDLPTIESDFYYHHGPLALCVDGRGDTGQNDGRGDSESGNGTSGSDGGVGNSGGRGDGGEGVGNRTASRGGMDAENAMGGLGQGAGFGSGGGFGSVVSGPAPATDWGAAIEAALNDQAMGTFGSMGLAGAYAGAATGAGFSGYGGIVGASPNLGLWDSMLAVFDDVSTMPNTITATPADYTAIGQIGYQQMAANLANMDPVSRATAMMNLDKIGMNKPEAFRPDAMARSLLGIDVDAGLADLGLGPMDTMNNTFATDMHDKQFEQAVADINAAARATSYESVVNAVYNSAVDSINGLSGMTPENMKDLAQVSVPEVIGAVVGLANPVTAIGSLADIVGMFSNDIHARAVLGGLSSSMGASRSLGAAVSVANALAGGITGFGALADVLGTGALGVGLTAMSQVGRSMAPSEINSINRQLGEAGLSMSDFDTNSSTTPGVSAPQSKASESTGLGNFGNGGNRSSGPSVIPFKAPKSRPIIPFGSVSGTVLPGKDLLNKKEEPWYGYN